MKRKYYYLLIGIAAFLLYSTFVEPNWVVRTTYDVRIPGLMADKITVAYIADVHTTAKGYRERRAIRMVEEIDPDFTFVSGDLIKSNSKLSSGIDVLSRIRSRFGTYLVLGNADGVIEAGLRWQRMPKDSLNFHILVNESVDCGAFRLVGLDDPVSHREDVDQAFAEVTGTKPVLVLTHFHPDSLLADLESRGADMVFSGHTHGGQIGVARIVGLFPYAYRSKYIAGLYSIGNMKLCVTRGVGTNIFPMRFLCRPEVVVVNLLGE
ncbi:MAG: metallophosphoesterase family protein [bacterium]|jgi:predicted MPP superfamily phosphohydrolase